jgi:hypothetical protein
VLSFEDAIRLSDGAIYAGRVTNAQTVDLFWIDLTIDIEVVVRGPAARQVPRAQAGAACDGIREGEWGYVVRGIHDSQDPRASNLFYRISRSAARSVLDAAGLPDTSTSTVGANERGAWPWPLVAIIAVVAFAFSTRWSWGTRRRGRTRLIEDDNRNQRAIRR